jgi:thermitase
MRNFSFVVTGLFISCLCQAQPSNQTPEHVPGRLLVQHLGNPGSTLAARVFAQQGATIRTRLDKLSVTVLEVPEASADAVMRSLRGNPLFRSVEYDYYAHPSAIPNDPSFGSEWHLQKIQAPAAWDVTTGSPGAIAVIDSGVDATHPDLAGRLLSGWNFVAGNSNTQDVLGHGTAVAGTLAAATNNGLGVAGVTWQNPVLPLVAVDSNGYAAYSDIAAAIQYAADQGVRVISLSIGGSSPSDVLQSAVDYAWNKGAIVVASAMNNSSATPAYPAACNHAIAVSATDENDNLASFSDFGSWITLSAPGNNILTTTLGGGYGYWWGTSFSAPIVSGVAALALGANPSLSAPALVNLLEQNADDLGAPGFDSSFGWGRVNAFRTVSAARLGSAQSVAPTGFTPILVHSGGAAYTDSSGHNWAADTDFTGGSAYNSVGSDAGYVTATLGAPVGGTSDPALYQTCRFGDFSYVFAVPNGSYSVVLKFAEIYFASPGQRVFNVAINGTPVLSNFDIFAQAGGSFVAVDRVFPVTVTGGQINVQFSNGSANWPEVNAIEIVAGN